MSDTELRGMACRIGAVNALDLEVFEQTLTGLSEMQRNQLVAGWLATLCLPGDAGKEAATLRCILRQLRDAWMEKT